MIAFATEAVAQGPATQFAANGIPVHWYLMASLFLFVIGLLVVITRRNLLFLLMGIELILNAASLNFVAFGSYRGMNSLLDGSVISLFIIVLAAAEAVIALAIVLNVFGLFHSVRSEDPNLLRE